MLSQVSGHKAKTKNKFHSLPEENDDYRIVPSQY